MKTFVTFNPSLTPPKSSCVQMAKNSSETTKDFVNEIPIIVPSEARLQNSLNVCVFKYARAVKQKVWNEAENRKRDWGETLRYVCVRLARFVRTTLTPHFTDFFTDFEKKTDCFAVYSEA